MRAVPMKICFFTIVAFNIFLVLIPYGILSYRPPLEDSDFGGDSAEWTHPESSKQDWTEETALTLNYLTRQRNPSNVAQSSGYPKHQSEVLMILNWTPTDWGLLSYDPNVTQCTTLPQWMKCLITTDRIKFNISDAVLFKGRTILDKNVPPKYRFSHQKWIFFENESPAHNKDNLKYYRDVFNITSTYSQDSDVPMRFMKKAVIMPQELARLAASNISYYLDKVGRAAWFVSHCETDSQREEYVKELQKHYPVDIYGECGPFKCGSNQQGQSRHNCDNKLLSGKGSYKYYLSFENSFCEDYVTEKLWVIWPQNVLQIVMGGVNYSSFLPEKTYLNVLDFPSPKALAAYLRQLDAHPEEYNEYLLRKRSSKVEALGPKESFQCRLCRYLHVHRKKVETIADIAQFWAYPTRCQLPQEYLKKNSEGVEFRGIS